MSRPLVPIALFVAAAAISAFTIRRGGAPFDEGLILQAAARVSDGQMPYRDFLWAYGPGHAYLLGGSFDAFGPSLMGWRVIRVLMDAGVATTVFLVARRHAPWPLALAGWLAAACAMAQPTSATPLAPALFAAVAAVAVASREEAGRFAPAGAGALVGLAAAWRLDFGLYAAGAVVIAALLRPEPARERARFAAVSAATATVVGALAYLPFAIAIGPADLYTEVLGRALDDRDYWTLPFPLGFDGDLTAWPPGEAAASLKDVLDFYVPLLVCAGAALAALAMLLRARREGPPSPAIGGLSVLTVGCLLYLLSRTDEFHAAPLLVVLCAALPGVAAWGLRERGRPARLLGTAAAGVLALLVLSGAANRLSALFDPPTLAAIDLPAADGARAPPDEAAALRRMVAAVERVTAAGQPIYTITRRSDLVRFNQPLVYVLADRPNASRADYDLQTQPADQRRLVRELRAAAPAAIVRWTDPASTVREPNLRGRPSGSRELDRWVAAEYRLVAQAGDYQVLAPR